MILDSQKGLLVVDEGDMQLALRKLLRQVSGVDAKVWRIVGQPRGGLVLAVYLSHLSGIAMADDRVDSKLGVICVDDIVDTGKTLNAAVGFYSKHAGFLPLAWFDKIDAGVVSVGRCQKSNWVVFPWEDRNKAIADREAFLKSRAIAR